MIYLLFYCSLVKLLQNLVAWNNHHLLAHDSVSVHIKLASPVWFFCLSCLDSLLWLQPVGGLVSCIVQNGSPSSLVVSWAFASMRSFIQLTLCGHLRAARMEAARPRYVGQRNSQSQRRFTRWEDNTHPLRGGVKKNQWSFLMHCSDFTE